MTFGRLLWRNLRFHWRGNLAVLLGVVLGTAVLTGALLVGDSLRGSLRASALRQLGPIDHLLVTNRLFRQELGEQLGADRSAGRVVPALILQGSVTTPDDPETKRRGGRAGRVTILGVDEHYWALFAPGEPAVNVEFWNSNSSEVVVDQVLARELGVSAGGDVTLHVQKTSDIPRESLLGRPEASEALQELKLKVRALLPPTTPGSQFSLNPSPTAARNVFVPLATLQKLIDPRKPKADPKLGRRSNALLIADGTNQLSSSLKRHLTLEDWGLVLRDPATRANDFFTNLDRNRDGVLNAKEWPRLTSSNFPEKVGDTLSRQQLIALYQRRHPYLSLESRQLFIDDAVAAAARDAAAALKLAQAPTLVYLADSITAPGQEEIAYAVVAAVDPKAAAPLGPFLPNDPPGVTDLKDNEIVLVSWPDTPLPAKSRIEKVTIKFYDSQEHELLRTETFRVSGWIGIESAVADDPDLTPPFPGITDQPSLRNWDPPKGLHYNSKRVKPRDERYWENFRTTPKAYVNLATGQRLWGSRFGKLTSLRLAPAPGVTPPPDFGAVTREFERELLNQLRPEQGGFVFDPVRDRVLQASAAGTDFGVLFLAFSVFLIAAALLLVGLLFRLNLERRAGEIGLLLAVGWRCRGVRGLLLAEGAVLAVAGSLIGIALAAGYAWLLLEFLRSSWPGGLEQAFLQLHGTWQSYLLGFASGLVVSVLTIFWATRVLARLAPRDLLAGQTSQATDPGRSASTPIWQRIVLGIALAGAVACVVLAPFVKDTEWQAGTFFSSGFLLLVAGLMGVWLLLRWERRSPSRHLGILGVRNASRHPLRSLLTVGLLATATFLIVAVDSFHKDAGQSFRQRTGGSGGFALFAESDVPLFLDLQSKRARAELADALDLARVPKEERKLLDDATFFSFRLRQGDDASCLNLAQPRRPRVLGVSQSFAARSGFAFGATAEESTNPWLLLEKPAAGGAIPVIVEANTAKYSLKSGLGEIIKVPDESGVDVELRIVGILQDSIFQSELLVSDANFRKLYPRETGYRFFLIDVPESDATAAKTLLELGLAGHGFNVATTLERVATYLAVQNTYLATFQALGGLGLLLGAVGLAIVLLRSVWERRGELALFRALGFRRSALGWLVLAETAFLLLLGLGVGVVAALLSVAPHLVSGTGAVAGWRLLATLALVVVVGLLAGLMAVATTLRAPLLPALRRE